MVTLLDEVAHACGGSKLQKQSIGRSNTARDSSGGLFSISIEFPFGQRATLGDEFYRHGAAGLADAYE